LLAIRQSLFDFMLIHFRSPHHRPVSNGLGTAILECDHRGVWACFAPPLVSVPSSPSPAPAVGYAAGSDRLSRTRTYAAVSRRSGPTANLAAAHRAEATILGSRAVLSGYNSRRAGGCSSSVSHRPDHLVHPGGAFESRPPERPLRLAPCPIAAKFMRSH